MKNNISVVSIIIALILGINVNAATNDGSGNEPDRAHYVCSYLKATNDGSGNSKATNDGSGNGKATNDGSGNIDEYQRCVVINSKK